MRIMCLYRKSFDRRKFGEAQRKRRAQAKRVIEPEMKMGSPDKERYKSI